MTPQILDEKTKELLNNLSTSFQIEFVPENIDYCEVFISSKNAKISYNPSSVDTESIAHELLHVWLKKFDYSIANPIFFSVMSNVKLKKIFTKFLCEHIGNVFDHYKMYPKYIKMGYSSSHFVINGLDEKCNIKDIKSLKYRHLFTYNAKAINEYIGYLISIYGDHLDNDYTKHLSLLKNIDKRLFQIVTDFWNSWIIFDIENVNPTFNSDRDLIQKFVTELEVWVKYKRIK